MNGSGHGRQRTGCGRAVGMAADSTSASVLLLVLLLARLGLSFRMRLTALYSRCFGARRWGCTLWLDEARLFLARCFGTGRLVAGLLHDGLLRHALRRFAANGWRRASFVGHVTALGWCGLLEMRLGIVAPINIRSCRADWISLRACVADRFRPRDRTFVLDPRDLRQSALPRCRPSGVFVGARNVTDPWTRHGCARFGVVAA